MLVSEKILEKKFTGMNTKDAYLKACKWISTKIIATNNSENITYKIEKEQSKDLDSASVWVVVYITIDEQKVFETNCDICRETTGAFFMTQNKYQCYSCKINPYRKRIQNKINTIREAMKGKIL